MADRTSAGIFGSVFEHLAEQPDDRAKKFAVWLWRQQGEYDFSPYQMGCDKALMKLGLAECRKDADGYKEWLYGPEGERE